ncbi:MAG TPA: electron transfer flavoprotein subunit beta [Candidatus Desulfofervidus auxilii]|uniref:Electron transfer flavoprotein subunit beta n=1 Tax=Desulfofervidus auxilii TaxID=1621989 RepID=A0A7C0Y6A0_DESA2|nr:electron transfer flavoprotein subunit beta [Candidatus Desulfofervidus auxilii]HDD43650.1 electron transfer flavoprotein subunit beta [Candidatus Desulfofervidus auxilii]
MKIIVPIKMVPDLVEELEIDESGKKLDTSFLRFIINEADDHAIEEAVILKEKYGGEVTVIAPDIGEVDDVLYAAAAKGVDKLIKIIGDFEELNSHLYASILTEIIKNMQYDLILTGCEAITDIDGQTGIFLATNLVLPYIGLVSKFDKKNGYFYVSKEFPGGVYGEYKVELPAVLGVMTAERPPRYVPVAKIRAAMKSAQIEEIDAPEIEVETGIEIERMYMPEVGKGAEIIEGEPEEVAKKIAELLQNKGIL